MNTPYTFPRASVPDFARYVVDENGVIYSAQTDRVMSTSIASNGVPKISLIDNYGVRRTVLVKNLVVNTFLDLIPQVGCEPGGPTTVINRDGDFGNNAIDNLAIVPSWVGGSYSADFRNRPTPGFDPHLFEREVIAFPMAEDEDGDLVPVLGVAGTIYDNVFDAATDTLTPPSYIISACKSDEREITRIVFPGSHTYRWWSPCEACK